MRLYDVLHLLGPRVTFDEWLGKFARETSVDNAIRAWERWKAQLKDLGVKHRVEPLEGGDKRWPVILDTESVEEVISAVLDREPVYVPFESEQHVIQLYLDALARKAQE